jgi:hypothetical protein
MQYRAGSGHAVGAAGFEVACFAGTLTPARDGGAVGESAQLEVRSSIDWSPLRSSHVRPGPRTTRISTALQ